MTGRGAALPPRTVTRGSRGDRAGGACYDLGVTAPTEPAAGPAILPEVATKLERFFEQHPGSLVAVYLFGSQARGTAGPTSDVDVAVLFGARPESTLAGQPFALEDELRGLLGKPVQLLTLDSAPPDLIHRVLRDGVLVAERDRSARIRFEVAARNAYFDLKPFLDRYRRAGRVL